MTVNKWFILLLITVLIFPQTVLAGYCGCNASDTHLIKIHLINTDGYYLSNETITISEARLDYIPLTFVIRVLSSLNPYYPDYKTSVEYVTDINGDAIVSLRDNTDYFYCIDGNEQILPNTGDHFVYVVGNKK
jgi:hypothetical protein